MKIYIHTYTIIYTQIYTRNYKYTTIDVHTHEDIHRYVSTKIYMYKDKITGTQTHRTDELSWLIKRNKTRRKCIWVLECHKDVTVLIPQSIFMIRITPRIEYSHKT